MMQRICSKSGLVAAVLSGLTVFTACGGTSSTTPPVVVNERCADITTPTIPITELGGCTYKGFQGGLYPGASNDVPAAHLNAGLARAHDIVPLDTAGRPSASGRYVLLSIGMSNTTQEFCGASAPLQPSQCDPGSFMSQALADAQVNHTTLAIANGAYGGKSADFWTQPSMPDYDRIRDNVLKAQRLTEKQVEAVWLKVADAGPSVSLPTSNADAYVLESEMGQIVRALRARYPNIQQVFVTSRIYAGYATSQLNPEPYAYESGFSAKWLVQAQIDQRAQGHVVDTRAGDLREAVGAMPWIAWGPYLWANGQTPRADGLVWLPSDFAADGTHPSDSGRRKVATALLTFFKTAPTAKCWFLAGQSC